MSAAFVIPPPPPAEGVVMICQSCPRAGESHETQVPPGSGEILADRVEAELRARAAKIRVVRVDCLSRCQRPCNARLAGRGKPGLELTLMRIEHADELVRLALAYSESEAGAAIEDLPPGLRSQ